MAAYTLKWQLISSLRVHGSWSPSSNEFDNGSWCQNAHLDFLVKMVPSVLDESAWIVDTHFRAKIRNFVSGSEPNGALFWGYNLEFILMEKTCFPTVYNLPIFEVVCKKSHFLRQYVKLMVKLCLVLHARPTGTQNQDPKPLSDLFWCHKSNSSLRIWQTNFR